MESEIGKKFHKMYNYSKPHLQISYPKTLKQRKPKTEEQKTEKENRSKNCPQKTRIEYPPLSFKNITQQPQYHKIDYVPRRKNKEVI